MELLGVLGVLGFQVTEKIGRTGAVAIYRNRSGPTVLVRTELVSKLGPGEEVRAVVTPEEKENPRVTIIID